MDPSLLSRLRPARRFDQLVHYACNVLNSEIATISVSEPDWNRIVASHGLPYPLVAMGGCVTEQSICAHVAAMGQPLEIADGHVHPLVSRLATVREVGIVSYLGHPLHGPDGNSIGAICVCNTRRRDWTDADHHTLSLLARIADQTILHILAMPQESLA